MTAIIVILLSQLFNFFCLLAHAFRFKLIYSESDISFGASFWSTVYSFGASVILPAKTNEAVRCCYLKRVAGSPPEAVVAVILALNVMDILLLVPLTLWSSTQVYLEIVSLSIESKYIILFVALLFVATIMLVVCGRMQPSRLTSFVHCSLKSLAPMPLLWNFVFTLIGWGLTTLTISCVLFLFGIDVGIKISVIVFWAVMVGSALPLLPGSLGTYEAAIVSVLLSFGISLAEALEIALALRLCFFGVPFLLTVTSSCIEVLSYIGLKR